MQIDTFLTRWRHAGGSERANYQLFIADLCALLEVEPPQPANEDTRDNAYVFERRVVFHHGDGSTSNGFIDCYRRGAFIGEAKKIRADAATRKKCLPQLLETLVALGRAQQTDDGRYRANR